MLSRKVDAMRNSDGGDGGGGVGRGGGGCGPGGPGGGFGVGGALVPEVTPDFCRGARIGGAVLVRQLKVQFGGTVPLA